MNAPAALPFVPLAEPWLPDSCAEAVSAQVRTTFVGPGPTSQRFAERLAATCEVASAVTVASGTVALSMACLVLGLKPGDEVIVPAYGVISVINAVASIGLKPRLADIDPATGNIDPKALQASLTPATRAVVFVDYCGSIGPERDAVAAICKAAGVLMIEDAAWSVGRGLPGRRGGGAGDVAVTSFSVPKMITTGQGGAVLCRDDAQRDAAVRLADQGDTDWRRTNIVRGIGSNLRMPDVSAALGLSQLERLDERIARKRATFKVLKDIVGEPLFVASDGDAPMQYIVFMDDPAAAIDRLRAQNIASAQPYRPFYDHPPYAGLADRSFPGAEFWGRHALYIPFGLAMDETTAERVGSAVKGLDGRFLSPAG